MAARVDGEERVVARLRRKATVARMDDGASVVVGYTQSYALPVHERMDVNHTVGQAKYLEEPFRTMRGELMEMIRGAWRRGLRLGQALLLAGLRLQRASQMLVPVDTGALRASAFTRLEQ